jgi:ABC-2 type transport system permease protein
MRAVMLHGEYRFDLLRNAVLLNCLYLGLGIAVFLGVFGIARRRGLLLSVGE